MSSPVVHWDWPIPCAHSCIVQTELSHFIQSSYWWLLHKKSEKQTHIYCVCDTYASRIPEPWASVKADTSMYEAREHTAPFTSPSTNRLMVRTTFGCRTIKLRRERSNWQTWRLTRGTAWLRCPSSSSPIPFHLCTIWLLAAGCQKLGT